MPTTAEETKILARIFDAYIPQEKLKNFLSEMLTSVAYKTNNYSVRSSIFSLAKHYIADFKIPDDLVDALINDWRSDTTKHYLTIYEFIGMTEDEWVLYCQGKYQCF